MNTTHKANYTLFSDRRLDVTKPARFSSEIEGEGTELFLRGFLVACLLAALTICNLHLGVSRHDQPSASVQTAVALVKPAVAPADAPSAKL